MAATQLGGELGGTQKVGYSPERPSTLNVWIGVVLMGVLNAVALLILDTGFETRQDIPEKSVKGG